MKISGHYWENKFKVGQRHISGTDLWARPLCKREKNIDEIVEEEVPEPNEH
jgi:hypothetical protein